MYTTQDGEDVGSSSFRQETERLLRHKGQADYQSFGSVLENENIGDVSETYDVGKVNVDQDTSVGHELWYITKTALPLVLTFVLQYSLSTVALLFAGRLGATEVGGVSIGNVTFAVTSSIFVGLATCLDTVCPQAYGSGNYSMVGLYFQRGVAISALFSLPVIALWFYSKHILSYLVKDDVLIDIASNYLRVMIFSVPGFVIFECGKKYLQAQGDFVTGQNILFFCSPMNILLNYLFVVKFKFGYIGSPIAITITYTTMGAAFSAYVFLQIHCGKGLCWHPIKGNVKEIFSNWGPLISLAVPGIIMLEAEFFAFEIITILSATFGTEVLAAQSIAASIQALIFQLPFSCSVAASNRIAYHIGSGNINNCKIATRTTIFYIGTIAGVINLSVLCFGRFKISGIFNKDPELVALAAQLLVIIGINQIYDVYNVMGAGVLRAQGRQRIGGYLNIFSYYVIGLPCGAVLAFKYKMEVKGFWVGLGVGILVLALGENYFVYLSNWKDIIRKSLDLQDKV